MSAFSIFRCAIPDSRSQTTPHNFIQLICQTSPPRKATIIAPPPPPSHHQHHQSHLSRRRQRPLHLPIRHAQARLSHSSYPADRDHHRYGPSRAEQPCRDSRARLFFLRQRLNLIPGGGSRGWWWWWWWWPGELVTPEGRAVPSRQCSRCSSSRANPMAV